MRKLNYGLSSTHAYDTHWTCCTGHPLGLVVVDFHYESGLEDNKGNIPLSAIGRWLQLQKDRGCLKHPFTLMCTASNGNGGEEGHAPEVHVVLYAINCMAQ